MKPELVLDGWHNTSFRSLENPLSAEFPIAHWATGTDIKHKPVLDIYFHLGLRQRTNSGAVQQITRPEVNRDLYLGVFHGDIWVRQNFDGAI